MVVTIWLVVSILVMLQSVATFFSQVMAKIGGNTAGPGTF